MAGTLKFDREYSDFGPKIRAFEKADDVGYVVTEFLWYDNAPFYPIGDLMESPISTQSVAARRSTLPVYREVVGVYSYSPTTGRPRWSIASLGA